MNMITPQEYTMNVMHQISDIENNMLEVLKHKLKVYDERLVRMEEKILDKNKYFTCVSDWFKILEAVCLWIRNPSGESTALTITPVSGGVNPVSAHIIITRLH